MWVGAGMGITIGASGEQRGAVGEHRQHVAVGAHAQEQQVEARARRQCIGASRCQLRRVPAGGLDAGVRGQARRSRRASGGGSPRGTGTPPRTQELAACASPALESGWSSGTTRSSPNQRWTRAQSTAAARAGRPQLPVEAARRRAAGERDVRHAPRPDGARQRRDHQVGRGPGHVHRDPDATRTRGEPVPGRQRTPVMPCRRRSLAGRAAPVPVRGRHERRGQPDGPVERRSNTRSWPGPVERLGQERHLVERLQAGRRAARPGRRSSRRCASRWSDWRVTRTRSVERARLGLELHPHQRARCRAPAHRWSSATGRNSTGISRLPLRRTPR